MSEKETTRADSEESAQPQPRAVKKRRLWRRWYSLLFFALIFFTLLFVFVLPLGAKYYLTDWLLKNGADKAHIDRLGWNPFAGRVWLDGVDLQQDGRTLMSQADLELHLSLPALFSKKISLTRATYSDLVLKIVQGEDGSIKIGTVHFSGDEDEEPELPPVTVKPPDEQSSSPWVFLASDVTLKNCRVHYVSPLLDLSTEVESLTLDNFSTREGDPPATLKLKGRVDGEPISLDLTALRVLPELKVAGKVDVSAFDLDRLDTIMKDALPYFNGVAALDGTVDFSMNKERLRVDWNGLVSVRGADVGADSFRTSAKVLTYDGRVIYTMPAEAPMEVSTDGKLAADDYRLSVPGVKMSETEKRVLLDGRTTVVINDGVVVDFKGGLTLDGVGLAMPIFESGAKKLTYKGRVSYDLAKENLVKTNGELYLNGLNYTMPDSAMSVKEEEFRWKGQLDYQGLRNGEANVVESNGTLSLKPLKFASGGGDERIAVDLGGLDWGGRFSFAMPETGSRIAVDGSLRGGSVDFALAAAGMSVKEEAFLWKGQLDYRGLRNGETNVVESDGTLSLKPLKFASGGGDEKIVADLEGIDWDGHFLFAMPEAGSRIAVDGNVRGGTIDVDLAAAGVRVREESLQVAAKTGVTFGEIIDITGTAAVDAAGFSLHLGDEEQPMMTLDRLKVTDLQGRGDKKLTVAQLAAAGLTANVAGTMPLRVSVPDISLNAFSTDDLQKFTIDELAINKPKVIATHNSAELLDLDDITFTRLAAATDGSASVDRLSVNKLVFLRNREGSINGAGVSLGEARFSGITWSGKDGFSGKKLLFRNLAGTVVRDKNGAINIADRLAAMSTAPPAAKETEAVSPTKKKTRAPKGEPLPLPFPVVLGEVGISGNSGLSFTDHTLAEPFKTSLQVQEFTVGRLDSHQVTAKTPVHFRGSFEKRAPLKIDGTVSPFLLDPGAQLNIKLRNFPLENISAYVVQSVGTGLARGQMQLTTTIDLADNYLKMKNNVVLANLETKIISKELAAKLDNQLPVPLSMALSLLRNKDGAINLDIPLQGAPDALNVGVTDVIVTALSKAVVPALSGYAVYALGPYGALAYAGMKMGEELMKKGDIPVIFIKGAKNLVPLQMKGLEKAGERIKKGEGDWQICSYVASWEFMSKAEIAAVSGSRVPTPAADVQRLDMLGQIRARNVQQWLVKNYGIDEDRLLLCTTTIKTEKKMLPVVVIQK